MKLHWSPRSPFVRKVMIVAHETGLVDRLSLVRTPVAMTSVNMDLLSDNPLSKLPTLVLDDGTSLYDSVVICEHLDTLHDGPRLFPLDPQEKWSALRRHALGDGLLELLILWRNEREREHPAEAFLEAFRTKFEATLEHLDQDADGLAATTFGIGHVAIGCGLSYIDFRFPDLDWRRGRPRIAAWHASFSERPSVRATEAREG
jgi:glutathione S-transferase